MKIKILFYFLILLACTCILIGCGDQPLFDELATNRIKVVIKGSYESNNPRPWVMADNFEDSDSVYIYEAASEDEKPVRFMLDVAGITVSSGKHKQYFANYRTTYSASISDTDPFFNGDGIIYKNDDVRPAFVWENVNIYIRKMLFDNAKRYSITGILNSYNDWGNPEDVIDLFHEEKVNGFNFNLAQVMSYSDSLRMNYLQVNRIFPLVIPIEGGFVFSNKDDETVLEIRLVVKNFTKKYEYEYVDGDKNNKLIHYYALSDWLRNVKRDEPAPTSSTSGCIGGNLHAVARYYVPGKVATIQGNSASSGYVIALKDGHVGNEYNFEAFRTRPLYDAPKIPRKPVMPSAPDNENYLEALLQYYLRYETYKEKYDDFIDDVNNNLYVPAWDNYDSNLEPFKLPPLATWAPGGGAYSITNVPAGTYTIWHATASVGALPSNFTQYGGEIIITESDFGSTPVSGPNIP